MMYSMNLLKWLRWLCQKIRWRKSKWQLYHCPLPLSRKGIDKAKDRIRELYAAGPVCGFHGVVMIDKQREKEFLFELERLYHNYNLVIDLVIAGEDGLRLELKDADTGDIDKTAGAIEYAVDELRTDSLDEIR